MRFLSFEIKNFKGIEKAVIDLTPCGANIFTLIGLNESGKTTILEALSTFSLVKEETGALYGATTITADPTSYVPKTLKSNFTGSITISAKIAFDDGERERLIKRAQTQGECKINNDTIPEVISVVRGYSFLNSDYVKPIYDMYISPYAVPKGARKERKIEPGTAIWNAITSEIGRLIPQIIYFPTFLFNQPDKIVLTPSKLESSINRLYRQIIQDVASALDRPLDVKTHIVDRILNEETLAEKIVAFWSLAPDKQKQVTAALDEMSAHLTETVFDSWSKIFGGDFSGREIVLRPGVDVDESDNRQVYIEFAIKDGKSNYDIAERSMGFRWFFSFLLFTLYRVSAAERRPVLFLLDEPASNLHARAQMQLIESLPRIATGSNQIMYSTHSHYMVSPDWLDQAFIVSNESIDYDRLDDGNKALRGRPTNISIERYRAFVGRNPDKTTYFQPVLDKLDVVPSRLDLVRPSALVEGKGDYLILEYGRRVLLESKSEVAVVPTRGAAGMDELIGLFLGWGVEFVVCLDDDVAGRRARGTYISEWGLLESRVWTLGDVDKTLKGMKIEGLLEPGDLDLIKEHYKCVGAPTKSQVQLFFSEMLARKEKVTLSTEYKARVTNFENALKIAF